MAQLMPFTIYQVKKCKEQQVWDMHKNPILHKEINKNQALNNIK